MSRLSKIFCSSVVLTVALSNPYVSSAQTHSSINHDERVVIEENFKKFAASEEAKRIFTGLETYKNFYTVDEMGYHFSKQAEKNIPADIYQLLEETFDSANEEIAKTSMANKNLDKMTSTIAPDVADPGAGYTYVPARSSDTCFYVSSNPDVGCWLYLNDKDTRSLVNNLLVQSTVSYIAGKILAFFPSHPVTSILKHASDAAVFAYGLGASYISNANTGKGVYFRVYKAGAYCRAR